MNPIDVLELYKAGIITLGEARRSLGFAEQIPSFSFDDYGKAKLSDTNRTATGAIHGIR